MGTVLLKVKTFYALRSPYSLSAIKKYHKSLRADKISLAYNREKRACRLLSADDKP